jgi:hypothetical protein
MSLKVEYDLTGTGWATAKIRTRWQSAAMVVSYLHDTLFDLVTASNLLLTGACEANVILMDEPGEHHIILQSSDQVNLNIEIRHFSDWASWNMCPNENYKTILSTHDTVSNFATQIFRNSSRILATYDLAGYKEKWVEHEFPIEAFNRLKTLLSK